MYRINAGQVTLRHYKAGLALGFAYGTDPWTWTAVPAGQNYFRAEKYSPTRTKKGTRVSWAFGYSYQAKQCGWMEVALKRVQRVSTGPRPPAGPNCSERYARWGYMVLPPAIRPSKPPTNPDDPVGNTRSNRYGNYTNTYPVYVEFGGRRYDLPAMRDGFLHSRVRPYTVPTRITNQPGCRPYLNWSSSQGRLVNPVMIQNPAIPKTIIAADGSLVPGMRVKWRYNLNSKAAVGVWTFNKRAPVARWVLFERRCLDEAVTARNLKQTTTCFGQGKYVRYASGVAPRDRDLLYASTCVSRTHKSALGVK